MSISFFKYQGVGNDFVLIDNCSLTFPKKDFSLIEAMCDRRFGIGADGLILIEEDSDSDFNMVYYNSDGRESTMCGNGGRCIVAFAKQLGLIEKMTTFRAIDGMHQAEILPDGRIALGMNDVKEVRVLDSKRFELDTGSPHVVVVDEEIPMEIIGPAREIRNSEVYREEGINVNFIRISGDVIDIRTYERGVEDETLACGTGSVAAAIVAAGLNGGNSFKVKTQGGDLEVEFDKSVGFENVRLIGPATYVFRGIWP